MPDVLQNSSIKIILILDIWILGHILQSWGILRCSNTDFGNFQDFSQI